MTFSSLRGFFSIYQLRTKNETWYACVVAVKLEGINSGLMVANLTRYISNSADMSNSHCPLVISQCSKIFLVFGVWTISGFFRRIPSSMNHENWCDAFHTTDKWYMTQDHKSKVWNFSNYKREQRLKVWKSKNFENLRVLKT